MKREHHKRHYEIVTHLRSIYEYGGEPDWTIVPTDTGNQKGDPPSNDPLAVQGSGDGSAEFEDAQVSKREKKDAKCLARAAGRAKYVTQDEITHVSSVLHAAESGSSSDDGPASLEEMHLIEGHLRYNANVYNRQSGRRDLKKFAKIPDVDVDFDAEMERILDTFRITELARRNFRNRGLHGKELKAFEALVEIFKSVIVEDLVLVKKDTMEVRIRRAGYLRYTNRTGYGIVQDRYTDKDWKTGERITSSSSDFSGLTSLSDDSCTSNDFFNSEIRIPLEPSMMRTQSPINRPDRRHLQRAHTRVNGDDGLGQTVIEPYHTPLLTLSPCSVLKKHAVLRVVDDKENKPLSDKTNCGWSQREKARHTKSGLLASTREENDGMSLYQPFKIISPAKSTLKFVWATPSAPSEIQSNLNPGCDQDGFPALVTSSKIPTAALLGLDELSAQSPSQISIGGATECATKHERDTEDPHPVVSQKKVKKAQREFKRKAKKLGSPNEALDPTTYKEVGPKADDHSSSQILSNTLLAIKASNATGEVSHHGSVSPAAVELTNSDEGTSSVIAESQNANFHFPAGTTPKEVLYTFHGKHDHWMRFSRIFDVD
ncbi:hypothetical protein G6514_003771 [Epicoccum nigrum]|nr:hypothetical protein G6514_003771 [Epicoccum nigrum]